MDAVTETELGDLRATVNKLLTAPTGDLWTRLAAAGFATLLVEAGDSGLRVVAAVAEQLGRALADVPFVTTSGGVAAIVRTQPQLAARLDRGAALAIPSSVGIGSHNQTHPVLRNGTVTGVVHNALADPRSAFFIVPATDDGELCLLVVESSDAQLIEVASVDSTRPLTTLRLENCPAQLLIRGATAREALADAIRIETVVLSAEMIGAAEAALEEIQAFVTQRVAFGRLLATHQAIRHRCVDRFVEIAAARALLADASDPLSVALLKLAAGRALTKVAEDSTLLQGAIGFTWEGSSHRYRRRALVDCAIRGDEADLSRLLDEHLAEPIQPQIPDDTFSRTATAWLDAAAPAFGHEVDDRGYFGVLDEQQLADRLTRARGWEHAKCEAGWAGLAVPTEYGGQGRSAYEAGVFALLESGYRLPHVQFEITRAVVLPALLAWGSEAQKCFHLPRILDGTDLWCQLSSEPEAGSDLGMLAVKAARTDRGWRISGQKIWTSGAQWADFGLLLARSDPEQPKHRGISAFVVPMDAPGIEIRPIRQATGYAGFCEVFFDDVELAADSIVGVPGNGWAVAMATLTNERQALSGSGIPFDRIFRLAREVGASEVARFHLRELFVSLRGLQAMTRASLAALRMGTTPGPEASISKLLTGQAAHHGAAAVTAMLGTALAARPEWSDFVLGNVGLRIGGGTEEVQKNVIADRILHLPREPRGAADIPWIRLARTHPTTSGKV
ncbi:acyl-CoA dehydrogenase family protein [Kribbella sp. NPDC058245]|uniref:acyl-CoA dehydrogenase family protein n=1 Tax=Kribbella sp. NPDC058245 TaxID=3346399 RepID=UPI0036E5E1B5